MALADYYGRAALAASQVLGGFNEATFRSVLLKAPVGIVAGAEACDTAEGRTLVELTVRLVARLYPSLHIGGHDQSFVDDLTRLALAINPNIDVVDRATVGIAVAGKEHPFETAIHAGSSGWNALVSHRSPVPVGKTLNPFGAAAAACLSSGELFKLVFGISSANDVDIRFSTFDREVALTEGVTDGPWDLENEAVLVGVGAIGNGAAWALGRAPLDGVINLVDPEVIEVSNLQRYVLCDRADEARSKVEVAGSHLVGRLKPHTAAVPWESFVGERGYEWPAVLVAVDTAKDRRAIQATLPAWLANAWTQPGDLGLSVHGAFHEAGACLSCLYLPRGVAPNEDEIVATALGIPEHLAEVRTLLHSGQAVREELANSVAQGLGLSTDVVSTFIGRPIREVYVEGVCGGALVPLGLTGSPRQELHVPLAHQSALAGVLLAAALVRFAIRGIEEPTTVTRLDVLGMLGGYLTQPALREGSGRCICEDRDFLEVFQAKYRGSLMSSKS